MPSVSTRGDQTGLVCALVNSQSRQVITKGFLATEGGLEDFLKWVKQQEQVMVTLEGSHGQSRPIEKVLREADLVFYSFKPPDTDKFRKAVLGQNKDNERDTESVARYALAMESQGKLERYKRVWFPDMEGVLASQGEVQMHGGVLSTFYLQPI